MQIKRIQVGWIGTNCYLLIDEATRQAAIVDPGFEAKRIVREAEGLTVTHILLTHNHFDHTGAVEAVRAATGALVTMHEAAAAPEELHLLARRDITVRPDLLLGDGDRISVGGLTVEALLTPGHTAGDCCYQCGDTLFTGDVLFLEEVGRTDLAGGDYETLLASLRRLSALPGDYRVLPGHGAETTLEHERGYNPYIKVALS